MKLARSDRGTFAGEMLQSRYRALDLEPLAVEDCYIAVLELTSTVKEDQRLYHVIVENDRGSDRRSLMLRVEEPGQVIMTIFLAERGTVDTGDVPSGCPRVSPPHYLAHSGPN